MEGLGCLGFWVEVFGLRAFWVYGPTIIQAHIFPNRFACQLLLPNSRVPNNLALGS